MNLRKRKSKEKQVEIFNHSVEDTEDATSSLTNEERALNENFWGNKRVKLEETKAVLNEIVNIEDEGGGFNDRDDNSSDWEKVDENATTRVNTKVSDKFTFK